MIIYFIVFILSFGMALFAEKFYISKNKTLFIFFSFMAILIPSIMAGMRGINVGTDTKYYISNVFSLVQNCNSLLEAIKLIYLNLNIEPLYTFINYSCFKIFGNNIHTLYFLLEFIMLFFIYMACIDNKNDKNKFSLMYLVFLLLFFNKSLNNCRQSIAIAISLYSLKFVINKKFFKYILFCLMAMCFHVSAAITIVIYPLFNYLNGKNKNFKKNLILLVSIICLCFYQEILLFLINDLGILDQKYLFYVVGGSGNILMLEFVFMLLIGLFLVFNRKRLKIKNENYLMLYFIGFIIYCIGFFSNYAWRLGYFFYYTIIFLLPNIECKLVLNSKKISINVIIIILLFMYSYKYYDINLFDETVPYYIEKNQL